jgi:hypothetical protein
MKSEAEKLGRVSQRRQIGPVGRAVNVEDRSILLRLLRDVRAWDLSYGREHARRRTEDRMPRDTPTAVLRESARVCGVFGRRFGGFILIVALLVSRPPRGSLSVFLSIAGLLAVLKYLGRI